jgi:hypothetical protein
MSRARSRACGSARCCIQPWCARRRGSLPLPAHGDGPAAERSDRRSPFLHCHQRRGRSCWEESISPLARSGVWRNYREKKSTSEPDHRIFEPLGTIGVLDHWLGAPDPSLEHWKPKTGPTSSLDLGPLCFQPNIQRLPIRAGQRDHGAHGFDLARTSRMSAERAKAARKEADRLACEA